MKFLIVVCFLCLILCIQPVENHFFNWIWNKILYAIDPTKSHRLFDCGKTDIPPILPSKMDTPRITGGLSAADHSFPWMVNVINLKSLKSCGGAIIGPDTIITGNDFFTFNPKKLFFSSCPLYYR
jgi:hypothetical protein